MQPGDVFSWERTFSDEDVLLFTRLSGDAGRHHVETDAQGRLLVHGLLTATLPTKIGGDIHFIAREMNFQFRLPVYTGDAIRCEVTVVSLDPGPKYTRLVADWVCRNHAGDVVMTGRGQGVVLPSSLNS